MARYVVWLEASFRATTGVEVEAEDEEAAKRRALDIA